LAYGFPLDAEEKEKLTATNVPGRKSVVTTAITFIEDESVFVAAAISRLTSVSRCVRRICI
jgi:hypothetical protein